MDLRRVAVIFAHPDDAEHACAGTIAAWVRSNDSRVLYVSVTSGERTSRAPKEWAAADIAAAREHHLRQAAAVIGVRETMFLHHPDGEVSRETLTPELRAICEQFEPQLVMTHDPDRKSGHSDHIAVGGATIAAAKMTGVSQVCLFRPEHPNMIIDISSTMTVKLKALAAHTVTAGGRSRFGRKLLAANKAIGQRAGYRYGEDFHVITI